MELFRIAAARGYLHPSHMLAGKQRRITSSELVELLAYERIRPSGDKRQDLNFALLRYDNAQYASRGKSARQPEDYLLFYRPPVMTQQEIKGAFRAARRKAKDQGIARKGKKRKK